MIYTGSLVYSFNHKFGKLPYRSIKFEWKNLKMERFQEVAQINFTDKKERFTRIIEHKHLTGQVNNSTSISYEFPTFDGEYIIQF